MGKQWTSDFTMSESLVQSLLEAQFPELAPVTLEALATGWDNSVFLVNGAYVFRFPRRKVAIPLLTMENRLLPELSKYLPIPIPNPCFVGHSTNDYPSSFAGYVKLEGTAPHMQNLTDEKRMRSAVSWALFLRSLHRISIHSALQWGITPSDDIGRMDVEKRVPMFVANVEEVSRKGLIDNPDSLLRVVETLSPANHVRQQQQPVVVHGDMNFRNFLVNDDGVLTGVIDWGDAHIGHPAVDLSVVYSFLPESGRREFFKVYGEVHPQTESLAKFRSLYTNIVILLYAHDIGDRRQFLEAKRAIALANDSK
ncbi:phosphotransferase [Alicyclobacillus dauci]|uniref:Phosphotransferase n=1 Tax=Alicyclobacillus dauci TaxID=1475485 RepID=A0ABY6Z285_9BACL|nr:phosphotransferase [Alicyclobacillus dauci]WAH36095.1 phosphotransferase [Alicyclobacillus dauci]